MTAPPTSPLAGSLVTLRVITIVMVGAAFLTLLGLALRGSQSVRTSLSTPPAMIGMAVSFVATSGWPALLGAATLPI